jgi:hypothetical protein
MQYVAKFTAVAKGNLGFVREELYIRFERKFDAGLRDQAYAAALDQKVYDKYEHLHLAATPTPVEEL